MPDNKELRDAADRDRIALSQAYEIEHLASKYGLSRPVIIDAVKKHGPMRADVEKYLKSLRAQA